MVACVLQPDGREVSGTTGRVPTRIAVHLRVVFTGRQKGSGHCTVGPRPRDLRRIVECTTAPSRRVRCGQGMRFRISRTEIVAVLGNHELFGLKE